MPPSDPLDDPLRNLWVGCAWPIFRNLLQTAVVFIASVLVAIWVNSFRAFLGSMAIGATVLTLLDRKVFRARRLRERAASNRFLGLPDENP